MRTLPCSKRTWHRWLHLTEFALTCFLLNCCRIQEELPTLGPLTRPVYLSCGRHLLWVLDRWTFALLLSEYKLCIGLTNLQLPCKVCVCTEVDTWWTLMQWGNYQEHHLWYNVCKYIFVIQLYSLHQNARMQYNDNQLPNLQFDSLQWPCMIVLTFACMFYILLWTSHMWIMIVFLLWRKFAIVRVAICCKWCVQSWAGPLLVEDCLGQSSAPTSHLFNQCNYVSLVKGFIRHTFGSYFMIRLQMVFTFQYNLFCQHSVQAHCYDLHCRRIECEQLHSSIN